MYQLVLCVSTSRLICQYRVIFYGIGRDWKCFASRTDEPRTCFFSLLFLVSTLETIKLGFFFLLILESNSATTQCQYSSSKNGASLPVFSKLPDKRVPPPSPKYRAIYINIVAVAVYKLESVVACVQKTAILFSIQTTCLYSVSIFEWVTGACFQTFFVCPQTILVLWRRHRRMLL